jgi:hypothetical protein
MIRRAFLLIVLLMAPSTNAFAGPDQFSVPKPDFSGSWELVRSESRIETPYGLAGLRNSAPTQLYIQQNSSQTVILTTRHPGALPRSYQFDGQTWLLAIEGDPTKLLMSSRIRGLSLITTGVGRIAGETVNLQEVLTMGENGRTLTLQVTTTRSSRSETNTLVYKRAGRNSSTLS